MGRKLAVQVVMVGLIISLACNFPFQATRSESVEDFRATLTALAPQDSGQVLPTTEPGEPIVIIPTDAPQITPTPGPESSTIRPVELSPDGSNFIYHSQIGDTLSAVAKRFAVDREQISSSQPLPAEGWLEPGLELSIPNLIDEFSYSEPLLPNSRIVFSPDSVGFNLEAYITSAGGYLSTYNEEVYGGQMSGVEIIDKVAGENSIDPRLLLALLEFRSGWVFGEPEQGEMADYPIGFYVPDYQGLYYEMVLTATHLGVGYYGWRSGEVTSARFPDGSRVLMSPGLNPGTAALQVLMAKISARSEWERALYDPGSFLTLYQDMFGDPWREAAPVLDINLSQPPIELPFAPGERWSFTGGPHRSWNSGSPKGALDFSPVTGEAACKPSSAWVTASAAGVVTRSGSNVVAIDLDGDGYEQTGWALVYLHVAEEDIIPPGTWVEVDQAIGHPSCERGNSTGTNVHIARKYNGEWLPADGPLSFVLSGWEVQAGEKSYQGQLVKGQRSVSANPGGPSSSLIVREE